MENFAPYLENAFTPPPPEVSTAITRIDGEIPPWLRGTYYFNGPARFSRGEVRYRHWLDGDGMVGALRLDGSAEDPAPRAHLTTRYVRSVKLVEEEAGRALYRTFGTRFEGDRLLKGVALASPVNVSVYPFAGTLLAFGEQGLPWELDPVTLETRGEYTFGRRLTPISPFSAHPKIDPESGELFNFGISFATAEPTLTLYRFGPKGDLIYRRRSKLDMAASVHDFNLSDSWIILYLAPYVMRMDAFLQQGATVMEALSWEPERGSRLLVFSRESGELAAEVPLPEPGYCLHHIHAFEEAGKLVVDVLELVEPAYQDYEPLPDLFMDVKEAQPARYSIDTGRWEIVERATLPFGMAGDFPAVDPALMGKAYDECWMLGISHAGEKGRKFLDRLVHLDWRNPAAGVREVYSPPAPDCFLAGEPAYVAGPEGRGAVLVPEFAAQERRSTILIFDAARIRSGPVATLHLDSPLHLFFHSTFEPAG